MAPIPYQSTRDRVKRESHERLDRVRALASKAEREGRDFTVDERREVDENMAAARRLKAKAEQLRSDDEMREAVRQLGEGLGPMFGSGKAYGSQWAKDVADKIERTALDYNVKALTTGSIDVPSVVDVNPADPYPPRRLIEALIDRATLDGPSFEYLRQTVRTNNAAPVADGQLKPTSIYTVEPIEDRARTVAHLSEPIPERYFADHAALVNFLDSEMREGVLQALETQALSGDGVGENMTGVLNTSGVDSIPFATDIPTTVRKAITNRQTLGEIPNAWLFNPADLEAIDLLQNTPGDYYGDALNRLFGELPKLYSNGVPAGTAILGDWRQARLFVREDLRLDADRSGANFTNNTVVLRAEGRFGIGILRPQAFAIVDLTAV